jgi:hypothetical protein
LIVRKTAIQIAYLAVACISLRHMFVKLAPTWYGVVVGWFAAHPVYRKIGIHMLELVLVLLTGAAIGYGIREALSRKRRRDERLRREP